MKQKGRTDLTRLPKRGSHDEKDIAAILDEGLVCHVSYCLGSQPFSIPTAYCRIDQTIYIHGSVGSHFFRQLAMGVNVCISVTLIDGLVLARSAMHHSINYRSVVLFGKTQVVDDEEERLRVLESITEHLIPGRWQDVRPPNQTESKQTMVLAIPIEEASAKARTGNVSDDPEDLERPTWAGIIPLYMRADHPIADPLLLPQIEMPQYVLEYSRLPRGTR